MCTALSLTTRDHYFGRTLDLECTIGESIVIVPRRFPFSFRHLPTITDHFAIIGTAAVRDNQPLYYDAMNEAGLAIAGLNFPGFAHYHPFSDEHENIASFELIPWLLVQCSTVREATVLLEKANICNTPFSKELPPSPLHWMISDKECSIVVEPMESGLRIHDNPAGVMTNSPPFDYHMTRLRDFIGLSPDTPQNSFAPELALTPYSRGMGAMGLPGDWSSSSRFIRAAYLRAHCVCDDTEEESVSQFFHILDAVSHVRGSVRVNGQQEITQYTSCCSTQKGVYYYTTYENRAMTAVDMRRENLDGSDLIIRPMNKKPQVCIQNSPAAD